MARQDAPTLNFGESAAVCEVADVADSDHPGHIGLPGDSIATTDPIDPAVDAMGAGGCSPANRQALIADPSSRTCTPRIATLTTVDFTLRSPSYESIYEC